MNFKKLFAAFLAAGTAGAVAAAEITHFYTNGVLGIFLPEETPEFQIKIKDKAPALAGTITIKDSANKVIKPSSSLCPQAR